MSRKLKLSGLWTSKSYEYNYARWLNIFKKVAEGKITLLYGVPRCWAPLILYLGGKVKTLRKEFYCDIWVGNTVSNFMKAIKLGRERELVEFYCSLRPELADALWKSDMEWHTKRRLHTKQKEFVVTTNNSFYRPELLEFINKVHKYKTKKKKCVLVPCSADKPYPSKLHKQVKQIVGDNYLLIVVSGAIGLAPENLFQEMPNYDSGIPYFWRIKKEIEDFFSRNKFSKILVYSDFNSEAIKAGLDTIRQKAIYVFGTNVRKYLNLNSKENLDLLRKALTLNIS